MLLLHRNHTITHDVSVLTYNHVHLPSCSWLSRPPSHEQDGGVRWERARALHRQVMGEDVAADPAEQQAVYVGVDEGEQREGSQLGIPPLRVCPADAPHST